MNSIEFVTPGLLTTIQDKGRSNLQHLGIPACGAMDPLSMDIANLLVGNFNNEAVLECTYSGPKIRFSSETIFAITGAKVAAKLNGFPVENYATLEAKEGDELDLSIFETGVRAYVAFAGGITVPLILDSRSTYLPMQFGDYDKKISRGQKLPVGKAESKRVFKVEEDNIFRYNKGEVQEIRVVKGPQYDYFNEEQKNNLVKDIYKISPESNRMGLRLVGQGISTDREDMISDGIPLGSIQITRGGQPIIMGADRQPTGGYPKIAKVILNDIHHLGQLTPGDSIKIKWVSINQSRQIFTKEQEMFEELKAAYFNTEVVSNIRRKYIEGKMYQAALIRK